MNFIKHQVVLQALEPRVMFATTYTITSLGGSPISPAYDIAGAARVNNTYIVGSYEIDIFGNTHGARLKGPATVDLPPLKGARSAFAVDVSENGISAGTSFSDTKGNLVTTWNGATPANLGAGEAAAISANGAYIVGKRNVVSNNIAHDRAFIFGAHLKNLGTLGGFASHANDVNNAGHVVGQSDNGNGQTEPFWWNGTQLIEISDGKDNGEAFAINEAGLIVGELEHNAFTFNTKTQIYTYLNPAPVQGGIGGAVALDVNNSNVVVGYTQRGQGDHATVWIKGVPTDLNTLISSKSGWELSYAKSINDKGQIVAVGTFKGQAAAALLSPNLAALGTKGNLLITGTPSNDAVSVAVVSGKLQVKVNGATQNFTKSTIKHLTINLGDGNDALTLTAGVPAATVAGGKGNDVFKVRNSVIDIVDGGLGNDQAQLDAADKKTGIEKLLA